VLMRRSVEVTTPWGSVRMKVANLNGTVTNYAPEFEDCRRIASERGLPLKSVMQEAIRIYLDQTHG
jgi:pyridinium-3,5-bisthiocarboxylic acid mononucleotide nickel chelatase